MRLSTLRLLVSILACVAFAMRAPAEPTTLEHLRIFLTGSFSSADQARGDQNFRRNILNVAPFWSDRTDGSWLYLEQALADAPAHPHRQLVYQLATRPDGALEMRVFDLRNPIAATGAWKEPTRLDALSPDDLIPRKGCSLVLHLQPGGFFRGTTEGTGCSSDLRGASYSTCEISITNLQITLWERGYSAAGTQVWGSIHGGHVFKRVE